MLTLFRDRNFRLLAAGQTLSGFGDYAMFLVFGIWAKELTGSNAAAGLTFLPFAATALFGPALGIIVDRFPRRKVMVVTDLTAALVETPLFLIRGPEDVWLLYVVAFLLGSCVTVYQGARSGLLVAMLDEDRLPDANGFLESSNQAMRLGAPLAGAAMFTVWGGHAVVALDAGTFLISAAFLLLVRSNDITRRTDRVRILHEMREGVRHIRATPTLRRLAIGTALVLLFVGTADVTIFALVDEGLGKPAAFLGVISSVQGLGSIAAGILAGWAMRRLGHLRTVAIAIGAAALGLALLAGATIPLVLAGAIGFGIANTLYMVSYVTIMQTRTPLELQGRVMTATEALISIPYVCSFAIGAALVSVLDFRVIYGAAAVALVACGLYVGRNVQETEGTLAEAA